MADIHSVRIACTTNPMDQPVIVIFGRDSTLLETRGWLLERTGARILTVTRLSETEEIAAQCVFVKSKVACV
jgi:hypothetical protein